MRRIQNLTVLALAACASERSKPPSAPPAPPASTGRFDQRIPGTSISIAMLPLPPGGGAKVHLSATEIPWEAYDSFVFGFDKKEAAIPKGVDAVARPSQPYITMDHSFGHAGYPVISVNSRGAEAFCEWLSAATGRKYRLPTEAEWEAAARADGSKPDLDQVAWTKENAGAKTHPIGAKAANAWGFHDLLGNAGEWCTAPDGSKVVRGGSYLDARDAAPGARLPADPAWNRSDPQVPKSKWWLANGDFIGFRVACEE
jgi:formylglycine-generating enzyme required for sulfatase activity